MIEFTKYILQFPHRLHWTFPFSFYDSETL